MGNVRTIDQELDQIYNLADDLMCRDKWYVLDTILEYITYNVWRYDTNILVGWATATFAGKNKLEKRKEFLDKCKELHSDEGLWNGLS